VRQSLAAEAAPLVEFADAMSELASGVVLVTCRHDGGTWGTTVTAFASVSADAPTVLVSLCTDSTAARAIAATGSFGVNILSAAHVELARYGSAAGEAKFLDRPVVPGALAYLDCELAADAQIEDHTVFFGRVRTAWASRAGAPLVYHRRGYIRCLSS
jgi:flavin reductase (DIM6/NTAB) family NADH-FMN oxidoreductase RutF